LFIETIGLSLYFIALLLALARDAYKLSILFTTQQDERDAKEQLKQQEKLKRSRQQRNDSNKVSRWNFDLNLQHQRQHQHQQHQSQRHDSNVTSNAGLTRRHASSRNDHQHQQHQQVQYHQHQRTNSNLSSSAVEMPQLIIINLLQIVQQHRKQHHHHHQISQVTDHNNNSHRMIQCFVTINMQILIPKQRNPWVKFVHNLQHPIQQDDHLQQIDNN
jgi:hypothetical protein